MVNSYQHTHHRLPLLLRIVQLRAKFGPAGTPDPTLPGWLVSKSTRQSRLGMSHSLLLPDRGSTSLSSLYHFRQRYSNITPLHPLSPIIATFPRFPSNPAQPGLLSPKGRKCAFDTSLYHSLDSLLVPPSRAASIVFVTRFIAYIRSILRPDLGRILHRRPRRRSTVSAISLHG